MCFDAFVSLLSIYPIDYDAISINQTNSTEFYSISLTTFSLYLLVIQRFKHDLKKAGRRHTNLGLPIPLRQIKNVISKF